MLLKSGSREKVLELYIKVSHKKLFTLPNPNDNGDCNIADRLNSEIK